MIQSVVKHGSVSMSLGDTRKHRDVFNGAASGDNADAQELCINWLYTSMDATLCKAGSIFH